MFLRVLFRSVAGLGGILLCVIGAVILTNADVPVPLMIALGLISGFLLIVLLIRALKTRPRKPVSGDAALLGSVAAVTALQAGNNHHGWIQLEGERWQIGRAPSELQSLMRISYAVFCLKKRKNKTTQSKKNLKD